MKIIKRIFYILFITATILSLGLTIIIYSSTTNKLIIKDNRDARLELHTKSQAILTESDEITLSINFNSTAIKFSCTKNKESTTLAYNCQSIMKEYDNDNNLKTVYYMPGDDFIYSASYDKNQEITSKTKVEYPNSAILSNFKYYLSTLASKLSTICDDTYYKELRPYYTYSTKASFSLKELGINKIVTTNYNDDENKFTAISTFNKNDTLTKLSYIKYESAKEDNTNKSETIFEISYQKEELVFPSFNDYVKEGN